MLASSPPKDEHSVLGWEKLVDPVALKILGEVVKKKTDILRSG